ncbi:MAG: SRPBCC family protein [Rhodobacteraceae bacterium]|nr:SRPBCC family protein [Paracoccaceae bacterium]
MTSVSVEKTINAPISELWSSWDDFANVSTFAPTISASYLINDSRDTGLGAERQCDISGGKHYLRERITGYIPNERMEIDIFEATMPIKNASAVFDFTALGSDRSKVRMTMNFTPGMGIIGKLMLPVMKPQMAKTMEGMLAANKKLVERSVRETA